MSYRPRPSSPAGVAVLQAGRTGTQPLSSAPCGVASVYGSEEGDSSPLHRSSIVDSVVGGGWSPSAPESTLLVLATGDTP